MLALHSLEEIVYLIHQVEELTLVHQSSTTIFVIQITKTHCMNAYKALYVMNPKNWIV